MIMRKAYPSDRSQLIDLGGKVFGDEPAVVNRILDEFAGFDNIFVTEDGGDVIAQLLSIPCTAAGQKGAYLYSLATKPEYRGQGVMALLMEAAQVTLEADGGTFFILIPASRSLFDYYASHGFESVFTQNMSFDMENLSKMINSSDISKPDFSESDFNYGQIPVDIFMNLRKRYIGDNLVTFSQDRTAFELEEQWYYDCSSIYCEDGYMIYMKVDDTLFVTEIAASSQYVMQRLILAAGQLTGCDAVKVTIPEDSSPILDGSYKAVNTSQAQYKWWGAGSPPKFYLRFALDDLPARIQANHQDIIV